MEVKFLKSTYKSNLTTFSYGFFWLKFHLQYSLFIWIKCKYILIFSGGLFLYYTRGKSYIEKYVKEGAMPSMPTMPTMPSMPKMPKKLTTALNWPLSNVQIKNLPIFLKKESATISANNNSANNVQPIPANKVNAMMAKPNMDPSKRPLPAR